MEWTEEHKKFIKSVLKRFGNKLSPQHVSFLLKRHMEISPQMAEVSSLLRELQPENPKAELAKIPLAERKRDLKGVCIDVLNEAKALLEKEGVHSVPKRTTESGLSALLFLSDLHFGEVVVINGERVFDLKIAEQRLEAIVDNFIHSKELEGHHVDECILLLGGDMIDGELIYPAQSFDTEGHAYEQIKETTLILWTQIMRLAKRFPVVRIYCVPGNHGRSSKLHHQMSNWDNVLYYGLQLMAVFHDQNIEVSTPLQMWMDFKVRNWSVHMRHIGVLQSITAGPGRKVSNWLNEHDADLFFYGHFHCPEMFSIGYKRIFKNGALPPANDFAESHGFLDSSGQWMIGITDSESVAFAKILIPE